MTQTRAIFDALDAVRNMGDTASEILANAYDITELMDLEDFFDNGEHNGFQDIVSQALHLKMPALF